MGDLSSTQSSQASPLESNYDQFMEENTNSCPCEPEPKPKKGNYRRRPSFYQDFKGLATSNLLRRLSKYDDELVNISTNTTDIISIKRENLTKIKLLGHGQYCHVHHVSCYSPQPPPGTRREYACKSIDPERTRDEGDLIIAAIDLACEAKVLSKLDHPNIVKLRGLCSELFSTSFSDRDIWGQDDFLTEWRQDDSLQESGSNGSPQIVDPGRKRPNTMDL
eukprot:jgi/Psemu1/307439/fgenesh1_kg.329_\